VMEAWLLCVGYDMGNTTDMNINMNIYIHTYIIISESLVNH
jgi:hypothetical protein